MRRVRPENFSASSADSTRRGTILDASGNPLPPAGDSLRDLNLSPGVQALIEARISDAVGNMREHNRTDLRQLSQDHAMKWKWVTVFASVFGIVSWFIAPQQLEKFAADYVRDNVAKPALTAAVSEAAQEHVDARLKPLRESAVALESRISALNNELADRQDLLAREQASQQQRLRLQELSLSAKNGDSKAFAELMQAAASSGLPYSGNARVVLAEVEQYYLASRHSLTYDVFVHKGKERLNPSVDEAIPVLKNTSPGMRAAGANELHRCNRKTAIGPLCDQLSREEDLKVVERITRAVTHISGLDFKPLDKEGVLLWWERNKIRPEFRFPVKEYEAGVSLLHRTNLFPGEFPKIEAAAATAAIEALEGVLKAEPEAHHARFYLVLAFTVSRNLDKAAAHVIELRRLAPSYRLVALAQAATEVGWGNDKEAAEALNKSFDRSK